MAEGIAMIGNATTVDIFLLEGNHKVDKPLLLSNTTRLRLTGSGYRLSVLNITSTDGGFRLINSMNVTFSHFSVYVATSKQAVAVLSSHHVTFSEIIFRHILGNSQAVSLRNSSEVSFNNCSFEGPSQIVDSKTRIGVDIAFINFNRNEQSKSKSTVTFTNCSFLQFNSNSSFISSLDQSISEEQSAAVRMAFSGPDTQHLAVEFQYCRFDHIYMNSSSTVHVNFSDGASHNRVDVIDSNFVHCVAKYGAGALITFNGNATNNTVYFSRVVFAFLYGIHQGGAASIVFINADKNCVHFFNCTFLNMSSDPIGVGSVLSAFSNARSGVLPPFEDGSAAHQIVLESVIIHNNLARNGVIYGKSTSLLLSGRSQFCSSSGSVVVLHGSRLTIMGDQSFLSNRATVGGAISLYDESVATVNLSQITRIRMWNNTAFRSGGALYSDGDSGQPFVEWINTRLGITEQEECFLDIRNVTSTSNLLLGLNTTQIQIYGNRAYENGVAISASSLSRCSSLFSSCDTLSSAVVGETLVPADQRLLQGVNELNVMPWFENQADCITVNHSLFTAPVRTQVATNVNWLFFEGASCSCLKPIVSKSSQSETGEKYWHFINECNATQISSYAHSRYANSSSPIVRLSCGIRVTFEFLLPPDEMFYVPWSHAWLSQFLLNVKYCNDTQTVMTTSQVILTPSPGEQFQLNLRAFDQFLRSVNASVAFLSLTPPFDGLSDSPSMAFLRHDDENYYRNGSIIFLVNEPILGISLHGLVNATGNLWVTATSIFPDNPIVLSIPFRLSPCHLGYTVEDVDAEKARAYILGGPSAINESSLSCRCITTGISSCSPSGKSVTINERTWAGDNNARPEYFSSASPRTGTLEELFAPGYQQEFGWGQCVLDFCKDEVMNGNWSLTPNTSPCKEGRTGRLCGTCKPGLTITPYDLDCLDCTGTWGSVGVFLNILLVVAVSIIILAVAMLTDISKSTTYDTLLFAAQVRRDAMSLPILILRYTATNMLGTCIV
jgi:hypothetical protein